MSTVKFYTFGPSPPCRIVYMLIKAIDLPVEVKNIDVFKQENFGTEYSKLNPTHSVPTIVDGDLALWESRAIMRYLVLKYGGEDNSLYPQDLKKRAVIDRLLDHDLGVFHRSIMDNAVLPLRFKQGRTKEHDEKLAKDFEWLENEIKGKKFLTGDDLTIADFAIGIGFTVHVAYKEGMAKFPNAMAWFKRIQELPYFNEVNKPFYDFVELRKNEMGF